MIIGRYRSLLSGLFVALLVLLPVTQLNADTATEAAPSVSPDQVIDQSYQSIQQKIEAQILVPGMPEAQLLQLVEQELGQLFDFKRVSRKVMGKYARQASDVQLEQFDQVFKQTLVATYSKGLDSLELLKTVEIGETVYDRKKIRAKVPTLVILKDGQRFSVLYRMFLNDQQQWRAENLIVEGINIGLVFRNQFAHYMEQHDDISKAIENWGQIATDKPAA
ncbi:MAG: ABC transporter substrate-binding protein [Motiliproteus sp.]